MTLAGRKNRRITIRASVPVADDYGGSTETLSDVATVWAEVEPLEGDEQLRAMQTGMSAPHRFTITYRADVTGATEIVYDGLTFNVSSVIDRDARHRDTVILADLVRG